jgi:PAS domain S-box-containing protein
VSRVEDLLSELAGRERQLRDARIAGRHAETIMQALDLIYGCEDLERGIGDVLRLCQQAAGAEQWVLLRRSEGMLSTLAVGGGGAMSPQSWPDNDDYLACPRRIADLHEAAWSRSLPEAWQVYRSVLSEPLEVPGAPLMAIAILARERAMFSRFDQDLLRRVRKLLEQAINNHHLAHRNAVLARMVDATPEELPPDAGFLDASFAALSRVYARLAVWQGKIVEITDELLSAPTAQIDAAINRALASTGALARSDRTYVFRLRPPDRMDNTHEWVADGIAPMIHELQDMPDSLLDSWREDLLAGRSVSIPDVEELPADHPLRDILQMQGIRSLLVVPMLRDHQIAGFIGYDAVTAPRRFLAVEVQLLQAVANAVNVVLQRAAAETAAEAARAGLEAERNRLRTTLSAIPDLVLELDADGRFVSHFAGTGLQAALAAERFVGRTPDELVPGELAALTRRVMTLVDRDGRSEGHEYQLSVGGEMRWFMLSAASKKVDGKPAGYVFAIRDITRRQAERRQLLRLSKIAGLTSSLVVITSPEQRIEWVNPAFERRTGWTLDEVEGRIPRSFLTAEETDPEALARIEAACAAGEAVQVEMVQRSKSGELYWVRKDIQPVLDEKGRLEGFVTVQTDITDLTRSHQRALRDLAVALDASSDGIAITDAEGTYVYMNSAHRQMFGIGATENISRINWRDLLPASAVEAFLEREWDRLEAEGTWRGEIPGLHRDGRIVSQEVSLTLLDNGMLCISRDIGDRLRLEAERVRLREELQLAQRRETIAHLASGVAHDLNNLVAVVAGSASLLSERISGDEEARAGVARILRATDAARDLVGGLGRLGRPPAARAFHDLRKLLAEGIELLGTRRLRAHAVSAELPEKPCPVWANATELLQVIVNLTLNACEAEGEGSNRVLVSVPPDQNIPARAPDAGALLPGRTHVLFKVSDTGAGMQPEVRARLFERYFTTKGQTGSGMGMPIVAGILRDNAAALWIDGASGSGTTVTIAWPADPGPVMAAAISPATADGPADLAGRRILVVDDLEDVADVLSQMLETSGAVAVSVSDPHEAAELLREHPGVWSALVTDLSMAGMRGTDLARIAAERQPPLPAILVTALPEEVGLDVRLFHAVLSKPIEAGPLIAAVREAVLHLRTAPAEQA